MLEHRRLKKLKSYRDRLDHQVQRVRKGEPVQLDHLASQALMAHQVSLESKGKKAIQETLEAGVSVAKMEVWG